LLSLPSDDEASRLFPNIPLTLLQYRPAWFEQLVLRIADIPHVVVNTSYASHESTGPLPALRDLVPTTTITGSTDDTTTTSRVPILVGRRHPRFSISSNDVFGKGSTPESNATAQEQFPVTLLSQENSILNYLQNEKGVDLDASLQACGDKTQQALSKLLSLMITTKLHTCLMILRYEDGTVWHQVYRKQCLESSKRKTKSSSTTTTTNNDNNQTIYDRFPTIRGLYQAWSERVLARKELRGACGNKQISVEEAKAEVCKAYEIIEQQLSQVDSEHDYLIGTPEPTLVDALLWSHLAEALCDVHLVLVLADFPKIVQYFQRIYDAYFATTATQKDAWKVWNKHQNYVNPFQQIPLEGDNPIAAEAVDGPKKPFKHALDLMQTLSARDHNLLEVLKVSREKRSSLEAVTSSGNAQTTKPATAKGQPSEGDKAEITAIEKARRRQQRHDQYWISLVAGVAILGGLSTLARITIAIDQS